MANWITFTYKNEKNFGVLDSDTVEVYSGDMFNQPATTGKKISTNDIELLNPCSPSKIIALWNNYKTLAAEKGLSKPNNPTKSCNGKYNPCFGPLLTRCIVCNAV